MQASYGRPFPSTPSRGLQSSQSQEATSINNNNAGARFTPGRRKSTTLTPSRYIPPSPLPLRRSQSQSSSQTQAQVWPSSQTINTSFQDSKYRVLANNPILKTAIDNSQNQIDAAIKTLKHGKSERRRAVEGLKLELYEEERRWETECETLRKEGADVVRALEREKGEIADATAKLTQLENRKRQFTAQLDALRAEVDDWARKLADIVERNERQKAAFEQEAAKDGPEMARIEAASGLRIEGRPRDVVAFFFTRVDPSDHTRLFELHLDASEFEYTVPICKPSLANGSLKASLAGLNEDRDLFRFLKRTREGFVDLVQREEEERRNGR